MLRLRKYFNLASRVQRPGAYALTNEPPSGCASVRFDQICMGPIPGGLLACLSPSRRRPSQEPSRRRALGAGRCGDFRALISQRRWGGGQGVLPSTIVAVKLGAAVRTTIERWAR